VEVKLVTDVGTSLAPVGGRHAVVMAAVMCLSIFVCVTSWFAPFAILPFVADGLHASVSLVGQIFSLTIFVTAAIAIMIGTLMRRHGYRRLFCAGLLAIALCCAVMTVATNVFEFLVAALLGSTANGIIFPVALTVAATHMSPAAGRRAISYQVACVFGAVAVGLPAVVLLTNALGWHGTFVVLGVISLLVFPAALLLVPVGALDARARFDAPTVFANYRELLSNRSLAFMYAFQVVYVICAFSAGGYQVALMVARGFSPADVSLALAVAGGAFVVSSVAAGEIVGRLKVDLRLVVIGGAFLFCLSRGLFYVLPLTLTGLLVVTLLAFLVDGSMAVMLRSLAISYEVRDRGLSMSFFAASDSAGQALGGIIGGAVLGVGGYPAIGVLAFVVFFVAAGLPVASRRLLRAAPVTALGAD
jgi:predicted MFS family arabinose efflux permease